MSKINNLIEFIEEEKSQFSIIKQRESKIGIYKHYGPPDMCYLIREEKGGFFTQPNRAGYFHYVYGVNTSSLASIIDYIKDTLRQAPFE